MEALRRILFLVAAMSLLSAPLLAQEGTGVFGNTNPFAFMPTHWIVTGKVTTLRGDPVRGAKVTVEPSVGAEFRTVITDLQGEFFTEYWLNAGLVKELGVTLTVTKKGFLKAREIVDLGSAGKSWVIPVTLRDPKSDPALLSQADLISGLGPRLRKIGASDGLSAKGEKDYARGAGEFLDQNRPDRSLPFFAKVIRRDPSCLLCRTMRALAELDSGDWDGAYRDIAEAITQGRADPKAGRAEPLLALGVMESWRHQPERAVGFFAEALKFAPGDALALQEVGRAELLLRNCEIAAAYLSKAIQAGAGPEARLLRVEALVGEGDLDEANKEMTLYLDGRDVKAMPLRARELWAQIGNRKKAEAAYAKAKSSGKQPIDYLRHTTPELQGLEPATDQKLLDPILTAVGKNVWEFFRNFPNTASLEQIHQEKLGHNEKVADTLDSKSQYLCVIPEGAWGPGFDEYRANVVGAQGGSQGLKEGFMLTSGFASASLIFHPAYQAQTTFRYLGRQKIRGRDTFVIAFAQRPAKARVNGTFRSGQTSMPTFTQGLAWVDPETYQILRLRTDLLVPVPEIRLERETTEIDYGEVHFNHLAEAFWLPRQVTVTVAWNGKNLRNQHQYSDFKLFNVESTQKIGKPEETAQTSHPASEAKAPQ